MLIHGQVYIINGNEPILLNDPSRVWVIQSGSMALFAVTLKDNVIEGTRRYLFTRIAIAHRLSTIRNAHRIYVLQAGRVVQQGTFQELAAVEGLFAQLMARQMA